MAIATTTTRTTPINSVVRSANSPKAREVAPSFEEVSAAYYDCRKNKTNTFGNIQFESNLSQNLKNLYDDLKNGSYTIGQSTCFVVTNPKAREVWAADFRDRVVHHILYNRIAHDYMLSFSDASCACIPERGTHYGIRRLDKQIRKVTQNWSRPAYYLKMDISNFFMSIDKNILCDLMERRTHDDWTAQIAKTIIHHDPTTNFHFSGDRSLMGLIVPNKSLFHTEKHKGLAIGNLSSQFFANVYMDVIDTYVDHVIKPQGYVRYVDDMILLSEDKDFLIDARDRLQIKAKESLGLYFNSSKTIIQPVDRGVDFVGYVVLPWRIAPRRVILYRAKQAIRRATDDEARAQSVNSYMGILAHAKSRAQRASICKESMRYGHNVDYNFGKIYK